MIRTFKAYYMDEMNEEEFICPECGVRCDGIYCCWEMI
jgi:hypothetical protein